MKRTTPMIKHLPILILLVLCCLGCDTAAKQQQAEEARRAATANELRQLGESMHEKPNDQLPPDGAAK